MRSSALIAILVAGSLAACGNDERLVPASNASSIDAALQRVADATNSGDCAGATSALADAQKAFDELPSSVDAQLRKSILQGLEQLTQTVPDQCTADTTETEIDPVQTTEPETTPTIEPPVTDPPVTTEPPEEVKPEEVEPDSGGISPDGGGQGPDGNGPPGQSDGVPPGQEGGG